MDYLIPVCLALLGLLAIFTPNWLIPVFIVVGDGWGYLPGVGSG
nr:hypothetical protein [Escherichia coli]